MGGTGGMGGDLGLTPIPTTTTATVVTSSEIGNYV